MTRMLVARWVEQAPWLTHVFGQELLATVKADTAKLETLYLNLKTLSAEQKLNLIGVKTLLTEARDTVERSKEAARTARNMIRPPTAPKKKKDAEQGAAESVA